jgi:hypothetical protein
MENLIAQTNLFPAGGFKGLGTSPLSNPGSNSSSLLASIISTSIGIITVVGIIWFVYIFITGAIAIMNAGGDKASLEAARKKITTGVIGLVIIIIAMFVFDLIGYLLGFGSGNLLNIQNLIQQSQIK